MSNEEQKGRVRMCKVMATFDGGRGRMRMIEFYVTIPMMFTDYERAAKVAVSWLPEVIDPLIEYEIEVGPPFFFHV